MLQTPAALRRDISLKDSLLKKLDTGINDMETGRELPLEKAFQKIEELRNTHNIVKL